VQLQVQFLPPEYQQSEAMEAPLVMEAFLRQMAAMVAMGALPAMVAMAA
jgi:hypothetical protein